MSHLKKLAKLCRKCPNVDTCPHKKMEAVGYLIDAEQSVIKAASMPVLRDEVIISINGELTTGYKDDLQREINKALYPDFLGKKFNVR